MTKTLTIISYALRLLNSNLIKLLTCKFYHLGLLCSFCGGFGQPEMIIVTMERSLSQWKGNNSLVIHKVYRWISELNMLIKPSKVLPFDANLSLQALDLNPIQVMMVKRLILLSWQHHLLGCLNLIQMGLVIIGLGRQCEGIIRAIWFLLSFIWEMASTPMQN